MDQCPDLWTLRTVFGFLLAEVQPVATGFEPASVIFPIVERRRYHYTNCTSVRENLKFEQFNIKRRKVAVVAA